MKEKSQHGKSPIDFKRDSGGSITVGQEGDSAICMIVLNDRLLLVMTSAVRTSSPGDDSVTNACGHLYPIYAA